MTRIVAPGVLSFWHPNSANGFLGLVAPNPSKGATRRLAPTVRTQQVPQVNTVEQPWQKRARKLAERANGHLHWNARRQARESRLSAQRSAA